jgi:hypothetical protein
MKLAEERLNVEKSPTMVESKFRIKTTAKAFKILSDGLYSDKKKAIVRELSTNAFDSHVMAGKRDTPFQVHLPNDLEPWFSVKDWGTGLSDEDINNIYTTYFESNKTGSNDVTGCLGLGSKSPFCYVDSFTVSSRHGGVERIYNAFINEDGVPSIAKMGEMPTTEENGLEVKLAVGEEDFAEFESKAAEALSWFAVLPKVVGVQDFQFISCEYYIRKPSYGIHKGTHRGSYIVMGNVAYPFSANQLDPNYKHLTTEERSLIDYGLDLFMNIGDVDMSASRESLQFNSITIENVKKTIKAVRADLITEVESQLQAAPDIWAARTKFWGFKEESPLARLAKLESFNWHGINLKGFIDHRQYKPAGPFVEILTFERERKRRFTNGVNKTIRRLNADSIYADGRPIFLNDMERGAYTVAQDYMAASGIKQAYMISENTPAFQSEQKVGPVVPDFLKDEGLEKVVLLCSNLPKPLPKPRAPRIPGVTRDYAAVMELKPNKMSETADNWLNAKVDVKTEEGVYVEVSYYRWKWEGKDFQHPNALQTIRDSLETLGVGTKIYGVRSGELPKVQKHNWESLGTYIKDYLSGNKELIEGAKKLLYLKNFRERENMLAYRKLPFSDSSPFGKLIKQMVEYEAEVYAVGEAKLRAALYLLKNCYPELIDVTLQGYSGTSNYDHMHGLKNPLAEAMEKVKESYLLLSHVSWYDKSREFVEAIHEYITGVDTKREGVAVKTDGLAAALNTVEAEVEADIEAEEAA